MDGSMRAKEGDRPAGLWCGRRLAPLPLRRWGIVYSFHPLIPGDERLEHKADVEAKLFADFLGAAGYVAVKSGRRKVGTADAVRHLSQGSIIVTRDDFRQRDVKVVIGWTLARIYTESTRHCLLNRAGVCLVPRVGEWKTTLDGIPALSVQLRTTSLLGALVDTLAWYCMATGRHPMNRNVDFLTTSIRLRLLRHDAS